MELQEDTSSRDRLIAINKSDERMYKNADAVCKLLSFSPKDVLGIFLYGSRLWGSATSKSDYDFLIVLSDSSSPKPSSTSHKNNIDALCLSRTEFFSRLSRHEFLCCVVSWWLPSEWVWKNTLPTTGHNVDTGGLATATLQQRERDEEMAKKKASKGDVEGAKKVVIHMMRILRITVALLREPKKKNINLWVTDDLTQQMRNLYSTSWDDVFALVSDEMHALTTEIGTFC